MGGACVMHAGENYCVQIFGGENLKGRDLLKELGVDWRIIL
jgi:hypothetical protein